MGPLRGVMHAAMVLDDASIERLTEERMWKAMAPKIMGAWNLHTLTLDAPLDFFVLFSSLASIIGNPGQANYVAGNAFLDALAYYRRARGLPALTINWGVVGEVGHVAGSREMSVPADALYLGGLLPGLLLVVMVGGAERVMGPVAGAIIVVLLPEALSFLAQYRLLFVGLLLLAVLSHWR